MNDDFESKQQNDNAETSCCNDADCCAPQAPVTRGSPKVGRNDPCPCDSGRKYKKCCGKAC